VNAAPAETTTGVDESSVASAGSRRHAGWIRRLVATCLRHPALVTLAFGSAIVRTALQVATPLLIKAGVDNAVAGRTAGLAGIVIALLTMHTVSFGAAFGRRYLGGRLALDVQHDIRRSVFDAVSGLDGAKQDSIRTGQVASRAITDLR